jgi:hypothetical protein
LLLFLLLLLLLFLPTIASMAHNQYKNIQSFCLIKFIYTFSCVCIAINKYKNHFASSNKYN